MSSAEDAAHMPSASVTKALQTITESPLQFFFSRYAFVLMMMVVVMNRIQHICAPAGRPAHLTLIKRLILRLPAIAMLLRPLVQLYVAMCRDTRTPSAQVWLSYARMIVPSSWLDLETDYASLFWSTFIGACFTQCSSIAARSLEHIPSMDDPSTFNLVSFGFLLYIHSTSRAFLPDAHVYLIVISRVIELLGLQFLRIWRRPPVSRLVFSSALGLLMTLHYVYTTLYTEEYPIIHSTSRFMEALTGGIIVLTVFLHAFTMLMTDGRISFQRLMFTGVNMPRSTDDYTIAVLKLGTACLHATRFSGLALELKSLDMPLHTYVEMDADGRVVLQHGMADLERIESEGINGLATEVRDVRVVLRERPPEIGSPVRGGDKLQHAWAFMTALYNVVLHMIQAVLSRLKPYVPPLPLVLVQLPRYVRLFWHGTNGEARREERIQARRRQEAEQIAMRERLMSLRERYTLRRPADLHAPSVWSAADDLDPVELISMAQVEGDRSMFQDMLLKHMMRPDHAPPLTRSEYRRLMQAQAPDKTRAMALSTCSQSTRHNAWASAAALLSTSDMANMQRASDAHTQRAILHILQERRTHQTPSEQAQLCVVCCCEPRTIIHWPCRCLALCDACRDILANQQRTVVVRGSDGVLPVQLCPTCRTPVMAFSRIYVP